MAGAQQQWWVNAGSATLSAYVGSCRLARLRIIIINRFVLHHKAITSEALGTGSMLVSRGRSDSLGKEECL